MRAKILGIALVALAVLLGAGLACADTITDTNVQFTGTVTSSTVTLDIQCLNASICGSWFLGDVTLKGFTFTGAPTLGTAPSGYTALNGGQNNSAVGNGGGCNSTQPGSAVCWDASLPLTTQLGSGVIEFTANITNGVPGTLHVQATAYSNSGGTQTNGGKVLAVSDDLGPGAGVPEPSTFALLGLGLLALAVFRRRVLPQSQA